MPAVAPFSSESHVFFGGPSIKSLAGDLFVGLVHACIGITILGLFGVVISVSKKYSRSRSTRNRESGTMEEKNVLADHSLVEQQRLYHHFPAPRFEVGDAGRAPSGVSTRDATSRPGRSSHVRFADEASESSASERETPESGTGDREKGAASHFDLAPSRMIMSRPPPPPPLTPPELSTTVFSLDGHKYSHARTTPELDTSFFQQPNPDYMASTIASQPSSTATATQSPVTPRRRSYTKMIPIEIPASAQTSSPRTPLDLSSSYPPTSFMLPGPPPGHGNEFSLMPQDIEVHGEIISALDDEGAGWTRHTRVYGGGVCLACASSGGEGHGGFYGKNVPPEHMR